MGPTEDGSLGRTSVRSLSHSETGGKHKHKPGSAPGGGLSPADLTNLTNFALTNSTHVSMLYANPENQQELSDQLSQMWTEGQKARKDRGKTLQSIQDSIAKIGGEIHKHRARTAVDINEGLHR
jgi:hypothetical protein